MIWVSNSLFCLLLGLGSETRSAGRQDGGGYFLLLPFLAYFIVPIHKQKQTVFPELAEKWGIFAKSPLNF
jgi:hypothetical protein